MLETNAYLFQQRFILMFKKFTDMDLKWLNQPKQYAIKPNKIQITTEPHTDYWQRTYVGFQNDNAPIIYTEMVEDFTFELHTIFKYNKLYDQSGPMLYQDSQNWFKIGVEYENQKICRLGSVVTNLGYSDWATTDIPTHINSVFYRVSRRKQDFYVEYSYDGKQYMQMRTFHMHKPIQKARIGLYACSPVDSSHKVQFIDAQMKKCIWPDFQPPANYMK